MGQNGAGKSTLIKVLTGVYAPDAGSIELLGSAVTPESPIHAQELGISAVHQESHLLPNLSVAEKYLCRALSPAPLEPWRRHRLARDREASARIAGRPRHRTRRDTACGRLARGPAAARHRWHAQSPPMRVF
jgi:simple sugar transport system ATP-binding protein